jgi:hypothetical protein
MYTGFDHLYTLFEVITIERLLNPTNHHDKFNLY